MPLPKETNPLISVPSTLCSPLHPPPLPPPRGEVIRLLHSSGAAAAAQPARAGGGAGNHSPRSSAAASPGAGGLAGAAGALVPLPSPGAAAPKPDDFLTLLAAMAAVFTAAPQLWYNGAELLGPEVQHAVVSMLSHVSGCGCVGGAALFLPRRGCVLGGAVLLLMRFVGSLQLLINLFWALGTREVCMCALPLPFTPLPRVPTSLPPPCLLPLLYGRR